MVNRRELIAMLPPATLKKKKVADRQSVPLIMELVVEAHEKYKADYDLIAHKFWKGSLKKTVAGLFDFCKREMTYIAESAKQQTVRSPAAILETANKWGVDCKHYSSFIGGVLDALKRSGKDVNWCYMFVSYSPTDRTPEHVFILCMIDGKPVYIDPVVSSLNLRYPKFTYFQQKFPMSLYTINGFGGRKVGAIELQRAENWAETGFGGGGGGGSIAPSGTPKIDYTPQQYISPDNKIVTLQPTATGSPGGSAGTVSTTGSQSENAAGTSAIKKIPLWVWLVVAGAGLYFITKKKSR